MMRDNTPKIYNYIRLMQEYTPCVAEWQYQDENGMWVTASLDECIKRNKENGAEYSQVNVVRRDLTHLIELHPNELPNLRKEDAVVLDATDMEKRRIEKMILDVVPSVDKPIITDFTNYKVPRNIASMDSMDERRVEWFKKQSPEEVEARFDEILKIQAEEVKEFIAYKDYVEICNSLRLLYNVLTPYVKDYLQKRWFIAGTGHFVGNYDNITKYYAELSNCLNSIEKRCSKICVSVQNGYVVEVCIIDTQRKRKTIPLLAKGSKDKDFLNLGISLQTSYIDKKHHWENVKNMCYCYEMDSQDCYSFDDIRSNVIEYIRALLKNSVEKRNTYAESLCMKLESLYRYLTKEIKLSREDAWTYICKAWKTDNPNASLNSDSEKDLMWRYLGNFEKYLPIELEVKH